MESSIATWEDHLDQIMSSTHASGTVKRGQNAIRPPRYFRRKDAAEAWELTKNSFFFEKVRFPDSVILRIDIQTDLRCRPGGAQPEHTSPAVASVQRWKLDDYAECVVEMLMTLHLGASLEPFRARKVSEYPGMRRTHLGSHFWRCHVLRDVVAHANGIMTIRPYPRERTTMPQVLSASNWELHNSTVAGEKRKAPELNTDLTPQQVAARKLPRSILTNKFTAVEQKTVDKSEVYGTSTPVNTMLAAITTSAVTKQRHDELDELRSKVITDSNSIIQQIKLKSASLVSSVGPRPTDEDLEDRLKSLDVDITAEDWVSKLAVQYACNKMEARFHQLLEDHHSEKIRVIKEFEQSIIDDITRTAETRQDHDLTTELAGL